MYVCCELQDTRIGVLYRFRFLHIATPASAVILVGQMERIRKTANRIPAASQGPRII